MARPTHNMKIIQELNEGVVEWRTSSQIAEHIGLTSQQVAQRLRALKHKGIVESKPSTTYTGLTTSRPLLWRVVIGR